MLNELLVLERGARQAGITMVDRHPHIKDAGKIPTLLVQIDSTGRVARVRPVPKEVTPWTLRDGQHNSFPFSQPKPPLWELPEGDSQRDSIRRTKQGSALLSLASSAHLSTGIEKKWPEPALFGRLSRRRQELAGLERSHAAVVPETIDRFLLACQPGVTGSVRRFLEELVALLLQGVRSSSQNDWIDLAVALLIGKFNPKEKKWVCAGALLFEAQGALRSIADASLIPEVSCALEKTSEKHDESGRSGVCCLTGTAGPLLEETFPQPTVPFLGPTYIFAKNEDIPANDRYARLSTDAIPVGRETAIRLAAAFSALTLPDRKGLTWRGVPGEAPKQNDLLVAFVREVPDALAIDLLAAENDDDLSEEVGRDESINSIAEFEKRTERLLSAVKARAGVDFRSTPVEVLVFRKIDLGNGKVVFSGAPTVEALYSAARSWAAAEQNWPPWIKLASFDRNRGKSIGGTPPHISPLGLIGFSKQMFLRSGDRPEGKTELSGLTAGQALRFFLEMARTGSPSISSSARRILRLLLNRRTFLVSGQAHTSRRFVGLARKLDRVEVIRLEALRHEALRSITVLALVLEALGRSKEDYMNQAAFKLGQLLAVADVVHAGYCADVRGGDVPPALLGNQFFTMAQSAPAKALAALARRWKPYAGWSAKASRNRERANGLVASNSKSDQQRGWEIRKAVRHAREMPRIADELAPALAGCTPDDLFRAELLLGYIAGLPKVEKGSEDQIESAADAGELED